MYEHVNMFPYELNIKYFCTLNSMLNNDHCNASL